MGQMRLVACSNVVSELRMVFAFSKERVVNKTPQTKTDDKDSNRKPLMSTTLYDFSSGCVWMWELDCEEGWAPKNDAFEVWCWRRLLRVPWTARRSNQPILKEISPGCSLEGLMLKLKLQYFGHLMQRADSLEKTLMLGRIGGRRRRGRQRMRWLDGITDLMTWVWVDSGS